MTAFAAASGASLLAHGVHWAIVLGGTAAMLALVLPSALDKVLPGLAPAPTRPRDEHERRVHEVRSRLAAGSPSGAPVGTPFFPAGSSPAGAAPSYGAPVRRPSLAARRHLPIALVASTAAAGVHAAVGPAHLPGQALVGMFFLACAAVQVAWAAVLLLGATPALLVSGAVGHVALLVLWSLSRTAGLPGLGGPEPLAAWDLLAAAWHVAVVAACARALVAGAVRTQVAGWWDWDATARRWLAGSVLVLAVASLSGVAA